MKLKKKLKRLVWLKAQIVEQRAWVAKCEANGVSYASTDECTTKGFEHLTQGEAIRKADRDYLDKFEAPSTRRSTVRRS